MKKYVFFALTLCAFATTAVTLSSCTSEKTEIIDPSGYSCKGYATIHDLKNELTNEQKKDIQERLDKVGMLNIPYVRTQELLLNDIDQWAKSIAIQMDSYIGMHPELKNTQAGIKLTFVGQESLSTTVYFNPALNKNK